MNRQPGYYWVKAAGDWIPAVYDGHYWQWISARGGLLAGYDQAFGEIGEPLMGPLATLRLAPGDVVVVTLKDGDDATYSHEFVRAMLAREGQNNPILVVTGVRRIEALGDEELARLGFQRAGSWRDRPPLL